jgi:hypothetical protein
MPTDTPDRSVQFVAKLVQLTQERKVRWEPVRAPREESAKAVGSAFTTSIDGRSLRIYKTERETVTFVGFLGSFGEEPRRRIISTPILEVLDDFHQAAYSFERLTGLDDLYDAASYSASRVDDLMESVLRHE